MPWDPVRHANEEMADRLTPWTPPLLIPPASAPTSSPTSSSTPRATSLAMLLNDATTYRSSPSPVMTRPSLPHSQSSSAGSSSARAFSMLMNPVSPTRQPTKLDQHPQTLMAAPPVPSKPPRIAYDPQRTSRPGSVLEPLTQAERRVFSNPTNSLRTALALRSNARAQTKDTGGYSPSRPQDIAPRSYSPSQPQSVEYDLQKKRKRSPSDNDQHGPPFPKRQKERDENVVAKHYDHRPEVGRSARRESPIFGLKSFNNWIKSVLMQKMAYPALSRSLARRSVRANLTLTGRVLDIGCGKGGDLQKWRSARIKEYVGLDIAGVSVIQARERWRDWRGDRAERFDATFEQLDCYRYPLDEGIPAKVLSEPFDAVTMQFCMHYAFETETKVRTMLENVTRYLRPGGRFIGTVPNSDILINCLAEARENDPNALSFGNTVYRIRFDQAQGPLYGHRYMFYLEDAVEDVPEYVVYWEEFVSLAGQYGLTLLYKREFHEVFAEESEDPEFNALLKRMKVVDDDNNSAMDQDQWDAANVYLAFAFEKQ